MPQDAGSQSLLYHGKSNFSFLIRELSKTPRSEWEKLYAVRRTDSRRNGVVVR